MAIGLIGKKIGMTRVYDSKGVLTPVTVVECGGNTLLQRKTTEKDGYEAVQVGFDTQKSQRCTKAALGHFKKGNSEPKKCVREFRLGGISSSTDDGSAILSVLQFATGDAVDVIGQSKGKGFHGVMRKHNFHGQGAAHGSKTHRRPGAIGMRSTPGRIFKNAGMPGHLGDERKTVQNLVVQQVKENEGLLLISGAIPGANGSYVVIRPSIKTAAKARHKNSA